MTAHSPPTPQPDKPATGAFGVFRPPRVTRYRIVDHRWQAPPLRIAVLSDLHIASPWTSLKLLACVVAQTNALGADLIVLAGDYLIDRNMRLFCRPASARQVVTCLAPLSAPLGVHGILGNHDWKDCDLARSTGNAQNSVLDAFNAAGCPLMRNSARFIAHGDTGFWLVGTDSQRAARNKSDGRRISYLDADKAFADVPRGAPAIHLAHEPDYFATGDPRAFLQISGHTHGGQIKLFGHLPVVPSAFKSRYAYGHIRESGNHLIVSGGLGYSGLPVRIGVPPEIVVLDLQTPEDDPDG